MNEKTITIQVPESIFRKLQKASELTYRSISDILASTIDTSLPAPSGVPEDVAEELAAMHLFSDDALWAATEPSLSPADQARLEQLNHSAGERELTDAEETEQKALLNAYHRAILHRAQALAILKLRGHRIHPEGKKPHANL